jgi:GNAT superfamily N-acetyltransferase
MPSPYQIIDRPPTPDEYKAVSEAVGWGLLINFDAVSQALSGSLFACVVRFGDETIGMGRIIGDGALYFWVQDLMVLPEHRGSGVGRMLMRRITRWLNENAPAKAMVIVLAPHGQEPFYERFAFERSAGMTFMLSVQGTA